MPPYVSVRVEVTSTAQVPVGIALLTVPIALIWKEPAHLTPLVFQNWRLAVRVLSVSSGSSGGFSSLLMKSPSLVSPACQSYTPALRNQHCWPESDPGPGP